SVSLERQEALHRACLALLTAPADSEARALADLGRTAFALQAVLSSPRQALLHKYALPQKIYFDASVLLPAIVPGHPLRPVYTDALKRPREAARGAGLSCQLLVGEPFLEEIVAHRENAVNLARTLELDNLKNLSRHVSFYGAENTNVYVSAFSSHVTKAHKNKEKPFTFTQFLRQFAPYQSVPKLADHLRAHGFVVVPMDFRTAHNHEYVNIFNPLMMGYEDGSADQLALKERRLVEHEAMQLVQIRLDREIQARSIFVSADRRLVRAMMARSELRDLLGSILAPTSFIGLIDIMVGLKADRRSLARLVWATPRREADQAIRDFLVHRALEKYETAVVRAMPDVLDDVLGYAKRQVRYKTLAFSGNEVEDVARAAQFLDRIEDKFFAKMRVAMEREERRS